MNKYVTIVFNLIILFWNGSNILLAYPIPMYYVFVIIECKFLALSFRVIARTAPQSETILMYRVCRGKCRVKSARFESSRRRSEN